VWLRAGKQQEPGKAIAKANAPRSYIVETATGRKCRNQHHLVPRLENCQTTNNEHFRFDSPISHAVSPEVFPAAEPHVETPRSPIRTYSTTGTAIADIPKRTCTCSHHTDLVSCIPIMIVDVYSNYCT